MPQEPVYLAGVGAWLARCHRRLFLLVYKFVLVKFVDIHSAETRGQCVSGHSGSSAATQPARLRSVPAPLLTGSARGREAATRHLLPSSARSRRTPTSGLRRNRKLKAWQRAGPWNAGGFSCVVVAVLSSQKSPCSNRQLALCLLLKKPLN